MHPSSQNWPMDNSDSLCNVGNTNTRCFNAKCKFKLPFIVAWIASLLDNIALGPCVNFCITWRYFMCSDFRYVSNAPESAFVISELVEVTTLYNRFCNKYFPKYKLSFNCLIRVAPQKCQRQFSLLPSIWFLKVASSLCPLFFLEQFFPNVGSNHVINRSVSTLDPF